MNYVLHSNFCHSKNVSELEIFPDSYLVCTDGKCAGIFDSIPDRYKALPQLDYSGKLVIPGLVDLHIHAPQYTFRGLGMDRELLDWLNVYTFPEEARYAEAEYADRAYSIFANNIHRSSTTRQCIFGTIHRQATEMLMEKMEASGIISYVGKVNMDRNSPDYLCESTTQSVDETLQWLNDISGKFNRTRPIITPRFIPTCSNELMEQLSAIVNRYNLPTQSHLSENFGEIDWVHELVPEAKTYGHAYNMFGMFGNSTPCIMAHCVHSSPEELELIKQNNVFIAHSPESNVNLSSGVAPASMYIELGLKMGLATDVAGGSSECMLHAIGEAIQASHLRWRLADQSTQPLTFANTFYLATRGGGEFFGKVGAFSEGYEFDAIVIDDSNILTARQPSILERLERLPYLANYQNICAKFVAGKQLF